MLALKAYYTHILKFYIWLPVATTELCLLKQIQHNKCKRVPISRENNFSPKILEKTDSAFNHQNESQGFIYEKKNNHVW